MPKFRRAVGTLLVGLVAVSTLSSCSPPVFAWGYLTDEGSVGFAPCRPVEANAVRVGLLAAGDHGLVRSVVAYGDPVRFDEGTGMVLDALPDGWTSTGALSLDGEWQYVTVSFYSSGEFADAISLDRDDLGSGEWALSPEQNWLFLSSCDRPDGAPVSVGTTADTENVALVEWMRENAMPETEFWSLMAAENLDAALSARPYESIVDFRLQLLLQLYALDTAQLWKVSEDLFDTTASYGLSVENWFLRVRCAIIAAGEDAVQLAVADGSAPAFDTAADLTGILDAPSRAAEAQGREIVVPTTPVGYGFGLNLDGW